MWIDRKCAKIYGRDGQQIRDLQHIPEANWAHILQGGYVALALFVDFARSFFTLILERCSKLQYYFDHKPKHTSRMKEYGSQWTSHRNSRKLSCSRVDHVLYHQWGNFRVAFRLCFKASPGAKTLIWKLVLFTCKWTTICLRIKLISIWKASHLDSLWNRGECNSEIS